MRQSIASQGLNTSSRDVVNILLVLGTTDITDIQLCRLYLCNDVHGHSSNNNLISHAVTLM